MKGTSSGHLRAAGVHAACTLSSLPRHQVGNELVQLVILGQVEGSFVGVLKPLLDLVKQVVPSGFISQRLGHRTPAPCHKSGWGFSSSASFNRPLKIAFASPWQYSPEALVRDPSMGLAYICCSGVIVS